MLESVLFRMCRGRTLAVQEAVDTWKTEDDIALLALDAEEAVRECLEFPASLRRLWNTTFRWIAGGQVENLNETRKALHNLFPGSLAVVDSVKERLPQFEAAGYQIERSGELEGIAEELRRMERHIFQHWPWFSEKDIEEARLEREKGECLDLDDAFAEIAGADKETWLRRVEEYKRRRQA